ADGTTATYTVTVAVAPSSLKTITAYSFVGFPASPGVIDETAKTIAVIVPNGTAVTALVATFTTSGAGVKVGTTAQTSTATANNFTNPVAYIVTAADNSTATYTVTVTIGAPVTVLPGPAGSTGAAVTNPTAISSSPSNGDTNVPTRTHNGTSNLVTVKVVTATFSVAMDPATITPLGVFTLKETTSGNDVSGVVTMNAANTIATFTPNVAALTANTSYTATISTAAKNAGSITAMPNPVAWSFTTMNTSFANQASPFVGQAPVDLLSAGNFVILAKTTITDVPSSAITGNVGVSPAAGSFIGVTCAEMTGTVYTVDATYVGSGNVTCVAPGPGANKTLVDNAILDMGTAYAEAAARTLPDATELGAGDISGLTIYPGLYKWSTNVAINTDVTLDAKGDTNAVWIFQVGLDLPVAAKGDVVAGVKVILAGGAKASNIFWQVGGLTGATLGTYSTFNGTILSAKQAIANTGAVVNGRLFADSQVTLQQNPVTKPAP
ncbi:MAG: ice-binding family protein, partial [Sulfuritalea sp.]|nr:ice-binding family protein [Sulfuritalea sp.]